MYLPCSIFYIFLYFKRRLEKRNGNQKGLSNVSFERIGETKGKIRETEETELDFLTN